MADCVHCRKLTLESLPWFELGDGTQQGTTFDAFKAEVKAKLPVATGGAAQPAAEATATVEVTPTVTQPATAEAQEGEVTSFWADKFGDRSCVPWEEFERAFAVSYLGEFDENMQPWVLKTVKGDMFGGGDEVTREGFETVCQPGKDFGKLVTRHVMERWAIQEIFSMDSSVRLTSIENLGMLHMYTQTHTRTHTVASYLRQWCPEPAGLLSPVVPDRQDPEPCGGGCPGGPAGGA